MLQGVLDDVMMNAQYCVEAIDRATVFIESASQLIKDSPLGAMKDMDRGVLRYTSRPICYSGLTDNFYELI